MYHSMNGVSWLWMTLAGVFWVTFVGSVIYVAVRLALRHSRRS